MYIYFAVALHCFLSYPGPSFFLASPFFGRCDNSGIFCFASVGCIVIYPDIHLFCSIHGDTQMVAARRFKAAKWQRNNELKKIYIYRQLKSCRHIACKQHQQNNAFRLLHCVVSFSLIHLSLLPAITMRFSHFFPCTFCCLFGGLQCLEHRRSKHIYQTHPLLQTQISTNSKFLDNTKSFQ